MCSSLFGFGVEKKEDEKREKNTKCTQEGTKKYQKKKKLIKNQVRNVVLLTEKRLCSSKQKDERALKSSAT